MWQGNRWADFFAKAGAKGVQVDRSAVAQLHTSMDKAMCKAKYMAWVYARIPHKGWWEAVDEQGIKENVQKADKQVKRC